MVEINDFVGFLQMLFGNMEQAKNTFFSRIEKFKIVFYNENLFY